MPLTASGKVDWKQLPLPENTAGDAAIAPRDDIEKRLASIWSEILSREETLIGIDDNFFQLGGHSLKAAQLAAKLHKAFAVKIPIREIFRNATIRGLANYIKTAKQELYISIQPAEKREYYPLSSAQKRMYILQQLDPSACHYNITQTAVLEGQFDVRQLAETFTTLIRRHESFRTSFRLVGGVPFQQIHRAREPEFSAACYPGASEGKMEKEAIDKIVRDFVRPFDLARAPLIRVGIVPIDRFEHLLMVDVHHIVSDGLSSVIFLDEFITLLAGDPLFPLGLHYKDFSQWMGEADQVQRLERQKVWWLGQLARDIPQLNLPLDYPRPPVQDFKGGSFTFELANETSRRLKELMAAEGLSLFMMMSALYTLLLSRLSGQEDIIIGIPAAARVHKDLEPIIGMFVNTLALRNLPTGEKTVRQFLQEVKSRSLQAFESQEYPFEELVEKAGIQREAGRNPLFDVMLTIDDMDLELEPDRDNRQLTLKPYPLDIDYSKFDMRLNADDEGEDIRLDFRYALSLFRPQTIETFAAYFKRIAVRVTEAPNRRLSSLQLASDQEKHQLLEEFNRTGTDYPADKTIHELFFEQSEKNPNSTAVVGNHEGHEEREGSITYEELDKKSDQLAHLLKAKGVQPDTVVGIMAERTLETISGILAILKAGGAYLPIDPGYPRERIDYMLKDTRAKVVLSKGFSSTLTSTLTLGKVGPANLAYIIYTSGSTGEPKGVMAEHRSVVRLVKNTDYVEFRPDDRILQTCALSFDVSTFEIWGALLNGLTLCLPGAAKHFGAKELKHAVEKNRVTTLWLTSPLFNQLVDVETGIFPGVRSLLVGGDRLSPSHINRVREMYPTLNIINGYGPTENVTFSTTHLVDRHYDRDIPIGRPIANSTAYILDAYLNVLPVGIVGELYVGGAGVARGYLNNPELTAEKFIFYHEDHEGHEEDNFFSVFSVSSVAKKIYKTGDLARWQPDGTIEFLGRRDHQVKIRGFRIELAEIQRRLSGHRSIKEAIVLDRRALSGEKFLCAYVVVHAGSAADPGELRRYLSDRLPEYMVPAHFILMEKFPVNVSGKVDMGALPAPRQTAVLAELMVSEAGNRRENMVAGLWKEVLGIDRVGPDDNYFERGGNSLNIIQLSHRFKEVFQVDIPVARIFRYTTIRSQAEYIGQLKGDKLPAAAGMGEALEYREPSGKLFEEVAVIGMAGVFPGARNIDEFRENLENGIESISFFSEGELEEAGIESGLLKDPNYVKAHGFLPDTDCFDAVFFDYIPVEAAVMDPQARLFHQCCWEALENAGYDPFTYEGLIGLYAGASPSMKWEALTIISGKSRDLGDFATYQLANKDFLVTRVSYKLNLKGPSVIIQTACSTSLVAVEAACRDLQAGKCRLALAGGVGVTQFRENGYLYSEGMISSSDGHCRAFDGRSEGAIPGNGAGVVVLKLSAHAEAEGDHIEAVIKGAAVNNDGFRKVGYTAPSVEGQAEVIRAALQLAGVEANTIGYIETHGTATSLGDPIEIEALKLAFDSTGKHSCALGSVKSNIGHLDAAAGAAGLIKTVLSLKHRVLLPSLHFESPNPGIDFDNSPFYVNAGLRYWPQSSHPLRAGVSSFGIGGTNAHVVLEEWTESRSSNATRTAHSAKRRGEPLCSPGDGRQYQLILLSAKTEAALEKITGNLAGYLKENPGIHLPDAAYTLHTGRRQLKHRSALVCSTVPELIDALTGPGRGNRWTGTVDNDRPRVIFMFPGLGSQYVDMGWELYRTEPVFKREMDRCFDILKPLTNDDIKEILYPSLSVSSVSSVAKKTDQTEIAQQVVFIFEYALARLLMHWGIVPGAMIGYSFGEYTAALLAGVFSLQGALKLIAARGRLLDKLPDGAMLSIPLPENEVKALLSREKLDLSIAIDNGPSVVVSGAAAAVEILEKKLKKKRILPMRLPAHRAIHSPMMKPVLEEFRAEVEKIQRNKPRIPYISNVTGGWISSQEAVDPGYWVKHLESTVRFSSGIKELLKEEGSLFLEVGPGRDLSALVGRHIEEGHSPGQHTVLNPVRHPGRKVSDLRYLLSRMGQLWVRGKSLHGPSFYEGQERQRLALPTYPFEKQRFPMEGDPFQLVARGAAAPADADGSIYVPYWKSRLIKRNTNINIKAEPVLMFHHPRGIAPLLNERLKGTGYTVISVTPGRGFEKKGKNAYTLNPARRDDYHELLAEISRLSSPPTLILHLWALDSDYHDTVANDLERGFYSLLYLARAVGTMGFKESFRLVHITDGMQAVTGEEELAPGKAAVLGPLKVIPQEFPNIRCRSIDIVPPSHGLAREQEAVRQLLQEITGDNPETIAALRGNKRWTRHFEAADPGQAETPLKEKGIYLVTGGLGKIGLQLAHYLARDFGARLVLTGRSAFPSRQQWDSWLEEKGEQDPVGLKIKKLLEVEKQAGGLLTAAVDVSDFKQMQRLLHRVEKKWGPVDGVIHAAGVVAGDAFTPVRDTLEEHCRRHFKPKIDGLMVLEKVLAGKELDFCWVMSSISAVLGGLGFAAYAAANSFMDAFVCKHNQTASTPWISVDWDHLEAKQTWETFRHILSLEDVQQVVVSSGGKLQERIRRWIKLQAPADTEEGKAGQKKQQEAAAAAWERPQLSTPYEAPRTPLQRRLVQLWQNFFKYSQIGIEDDFFELGGDSLKAITLISFIHKELNKEIPIAEFFKYATIRQQAAYLDGLSEGRGYLAVPAMEKRDYYPLSSAQKRLYVLQQMEVDGIGYNIFQAAVLEGKLDREKLQSVFKQLTVRHEVLRTSFHMVEEEAVQIVHHPGDIEFTIECLNHEGHEGHEGVEDFVRAFNLSQAPLLRVGLMELSGQEHIIMMDIHHIVSDGVSYEIFLREFMALYHGDGLPELRLQYKDYAVWQAGEEEKKRIENQRDFWVKEFGQEIPVLVLPTDFARPAVQSFEGRQLKTILDAALVGRIRQMASAVDATLFMALLSVYTLLLAKLSGQEDIVIGTPTAGREHADLQSLFGMFVNTLALRNRPAGEKGFMDFLTEVKERTLAAFANQEYLFEDLVEEVEVKRDTGRNPLFDVMFSLMNVDLPEIQVPGLTLKSYPHQSATAKFDLMLYCSEGKEGLFFIFEYCSRLFKHETVEEFANYFKTLVSAVLDNPQQKIKDIEMISPQEREQILYDFNDTEVDYPRDKTIHRLFEEQVERTSDNIAVLGNHEGHEGREGFISITYSELNEKSNRRAGMLKEKGVEPGDLVAIIAQRSLEMMIGIFAILKAGAAYLPVSLDYPQERIDYMLADSGSRILLTGDDLRENLSVTSVSSVAKKHPATRNPQPATRIAYIIYTSGSTGKPKGVMVEHHSVINRLHWMQRAYPLAEKDRILQKTPVVFDVSVWELFWWPLQGASLCLLGPGEEKSPEAIVEAIRDHGITTLHFVPSMLAVFLDYIENEDNLNITHLRSARQVFASGEALGAHQVKSFNRLLYSSNESRLINLYGPTEATVDVSFFNCDLNDEQTPERIPIGKPIDNIRLVILDRYLKLQPKGVTGELCIAGVGLARGYLNRPELTAERFVFYHEGHEGHEEERRSYMSYLSHMSYIYKTGDLSRWLPDGNIEYLGRLDFQVKIRGFRIELGEIEAQLLKKPGIKEAVVIAGSDKKGDQYLCAYITVSTGTTVDVEELRHYLSAFMPDYMIPAYFVELEKIPLTPNGKVDRKSLPEPQVSKGDDYTAPRTQTEKKLVQIWAEILDAVPEDIGIDDGFFQLGGHSLKATVMINKIHREFQVKLTLSQVFRGASIRQLAQLIGEKEQEIYLAIEPAPEKPYYALSAAQKRLYITQQLDPETLTYNLPLPLLLEGNLQVETFKEALRQMILRHEILRTSIQMIEGEPVQLIAPYCSPHFEYFEMNPPVTFKPEETGEFEHLYREFVRPFDLSKAPLLRVRLVKLRQEEYLLVIDIHHIISDGVSANIFSTGLMALYAGQELPPLRLQYKDFSHWQNNLFAGGEIKKREEYWLKRFEGDIPSLNLPLDYPEPDVYDTRCDVFSFNIPAPLNAKTRAFIKKTGATPYILLLTVYTILLSRYSGQEDIIVGSAVAGRRHPDLEKIMGVFINMLAMRNHPEENLSFMEFLEQVKTNALDAYENQDYQFDELVNKLGIKSPPGLTPLIDTQFTFQDAAELLESRQTVEVPGLRMKAFPLTHNQQPIQLGLHAWNEEESFGMLFAYLTALFKPSTIENMAKRFVEILEQCMENNEIKLKDIGISHALVEGTTGLTDEDVMDFEF